MNHMPFRDIRVVVVGLFLLFLPLMGYAQSYQGNPSPPPVAQQLVREGTFAVQLQSALGLGTNGDEAAAENRLTDVGIAPRNGWIADYPMTPEIVIELQRSVDDAARAGNLPVGSDEALSRFHEVTAGLNLSIEPYAGNQGSNPYAGNYPDSEALNDYYYDDGPPVVTYYTPPPDYLYLYAWVPYPFWWSDSWFPGFFILHDFHRIVVVDHRPVFVSNHFHEFRGHRIFHADAATGFHGRTFAGPAVTHREAVIPHGAPKSGMHSFNVPHTGMAHSGGMMGFGGFHGGGGFHR
jgi:hypothetical protein